MLDMGDLCTLEQTQTKTAAGGGATTITTITMHHQHHFLFMFKWTMFWRLFQVRPGPIRSFKEEPLGIADVIF